MTPAACGSAMDCRPPDGEHRCADLHPHRARRGGGRPFSRRPNPIEQNIVDQLAPPSADYPLGADNFGRDVLFRLLWGARFSLLVSFLSVSCAMLVGGTIGLVAGYVGGRTDFFVMQVMDVLLSLPSLILGLIVVALVGPSLGSLVFRHRAHRQSRRSPAWPARPCSACATMPMWRRAAHSASAMSASCSCTSYRTCSRRCW